MQTTLLHVDSLIKLNSLPVLCWLISINFLSPHKVLTCSTPKHQSMQPACPSARRGWFNILLKVLRLKPGGLLVGGPPCGSYVWINRATSCRSQTRSMGDCTKAYVRNANTCLVTIVHFGFLKVPIPKNIMHVFENKFYFRSAYLVLISVYAMLRL